MRGDFRKDILDVACKESDRPSTRAFRSLDARAAAIIKSGDFLLCRKIAAMAVETTH